MDEKVFIGIGSGTVEYNAEAAAVDINDLIAALESARNDGATHVVGFSGNYRGAQYTRMSDSIEWLDDEN